MGGGTPGEIGLMNPIEGLSNLTPFMAAGRRRGSIPAWAGEPNTATTRRGISRSIPGRGNRHRHRSGRRCPRSIPAWAGEPRHAPEHRRSRWVYPRVGGGTPWMMRCEACGDGLSPRGRGNQLPKLRVPSIGGSIPAWAGTDGEPGIPKGLSAVGCDAVEGPSHHQGLDPPGA